MNPRGRVRLKNDPGRSGTLTGRSRERRGVAYLQVQFQDGTCNYVPPDQLEQIDAGPQDAVDLLETGRLGGVRELRRCLTHVRLTGRLANLIYSMDMTGTDFYAYQFKPVLKLLNAPSRGILIADEVGLGKTIEAGLIWTELRCRFDFRRLLVLCPAVLRDKWKRELKVRFGVNANILGARDTLDRLQEAAREGSAGEFAIIGSMQGLRPRRGWHDGPGEGMDGGSGLAKFLDDRRYEDPLVDLVIVDEAHYLRNPETVTNQLGTLLRDVSHYILLLSATPVHLHSRDLFQLLSLVDEDTFDRPQFFDEILTANAPLVRARDRLGSREARAEDFVSDLLEAANNPLLQNNRQLKELLTRTPSDDDLRDREYVSRLAHRLESVNLLGHVVARTRKRDVTEWRVLRKPKSEEIKITSLERQFYDAVTEVIRDYCESRGGHAGFLLVTPQRQMASSMPAALKYWRDRSRSREELLESDELYEDLGFEIDDDDVEEPGPLLQALVSRVEELGDFDDLRRDDSKYRCLRQRLTSLTEAPPGEKVVLFSYFRATLNYLYERLTEDGYRCFLLHGGVDDKDRVLERFRESDGSGVLLSSEVGSEGVDLQFARIVVNYDLPWNPMRVEQRIGRVDRLGQKASHVVIWNLFCADTIDARIYHRLFMRLKVFERALGGLEEVLGQKVRELTDDLFRGRLSPREEEARIEQTAQAIENIRRHEEELEENASQLMAYGDYILNHVRAARELSRHITGEDIRSYVTDFFRSHYPGTEFRQKEADGLRFEVALSNEAKHDFDRFLRSRRYSTSTALTRNEPRYVDCVFENTAVGGSGRHGETLSQFHPLIRFVSSVINESGETQHPAVAVRLAAAEVGPESVSAGMFVFSVQRWSFKGLQDIEQLHFAAVPFDAPTKPLKAGDAERLVMLAVSKGAEWLNAVEQVPPAVAARIANEHCLGPSDDSYEEYVRQIKAQNEDRADVQEQSLTKHYQNRVATLNEVKRKHLSRGRTSLAKATEGQIRALENRVERRRLEIQENRVVKHSKDEILVGLIVVE